MSSVNGCFHWKPLVERVIPIEMRLGMTVGSYAAVSFIRSLICCMQKCEEQESVAVFRPTDEKSSSDITYQARTTVADPVIVN